VPATSLSRVATLGALCGHRVEVSATGSQAREAVDHVVALAERRFDEVEVVGSELPARPLAVPTSTGPLAASPGIAIGPVLHLRFVDAAVPDVPLGDAAVEWRRVRAAVADVRRDIQRVRVAAAREVGEQEARIFDAHLMLVDDADLLEQVHDRIRSGDGAVRAWSQAVTAVQSEFASVEDPYLQARASDVQAVGQQVAWALGGAPTARVDGDGVLVAEDLTPAQVAELDPARVKGIVLAAGSPTGHSAILARSRAIPAVVAAGPAVLAVPEGTTVALDGSAGSLIVDPDEATRALLRRRAERAREEAERALAQAALPAHTGDGVYVEVGANLGSVADARAAAVNGADLAGLVRTEFLYLHRREPPTVDEQVGIYRSLAHALGGRRLVLRTLDVGGDKPVPYLPQPPEANPFLGIRGIRLTLAHRQLFADQLRAIVEVAHETPVSLMFPMVSTVEELLEARRLLEEAVASHRGGPPPGLKVGMMVEVPAAALKAATFADHVDFFSIGTNDLTQYTLAAERGNPSLARLADPLDPGVLQLVDAVCRAAAGRVDVAVCGEVAADKTAAALLVALGVRELSVAPSAVPAVKQAVRQVESVDDQELLRRCLAAAGPDEVRALLRHESAARVSATRRRATR
jgi:phosphoenolpyruvate-protein phosphotransferase